jgi:hypothetical protein
MSEIFKILANISLILAVIFGAYKIYIYFFRICSKKRKKLSRLFYLIQDWFNEIDKNLESGINLSILNNKENSITSFIEENHLNKYKI